MRVLRVIINSEINRTRSNMIKSKETTPPYLIIYLHLKNISTHILIIMLTRPPTSTSITKSSIFIKTLDMGKQSQQTKILTKIRSPIIISLYIILINSIFISSKTQIWHKTLIKSHWILWVSQGRNSTVHKV